MLLRFTYEKCQQQQRARAPFLPSRDLTLLLARRFREYSSRNTPPVRFHLFSRRVCQQRPSPPLRVAFLSHTLPRPLLPPLERVRERSTHARTHSRRNGGLVKFRARSYCSSKITYTRAKREREREGFPRLENILIFDAQSSKRGYTALHENKSHLRFSYFI